jgi:hypothetical protein
MKIPPKFSYFIVGSVVLTLFVWLLIYAAYKEKSDKEFERKTGKNVSLIITKDGLSVSRVKVDSVDYLLFERSHNIAVVKQ